MRTKTLLLATLGGAVLVPVAVSALTATDRLSGPSPLVLAQATEEKSKDGAAKKGERPSREQPPAAKSEAPKAPPAARESAPQAPAAKSEAPKAPPAARESAPQAPAAKSEAPKAPPAARESAPPAQVPPAQVKDRAAPRAPDAAKSDRGAPPVDRGAEKAKQDDPQRSRTEQKAPDTKAAEPKSRAIDDRRGSPQQQPIQRQIPQQEDRARDRDGDRRDVGRDRKDDPRDVGRDRKDDPRDVGRDRERDGDRRDVGRDRKADPRDAGRERDRRDDNEIRERARRLDTGKTSRDELSRARIEEGRRVTIDGGSRTLSREGNRVVIRSDDNDRFRFGRNDRRGDPRVERLPNGRTRTVMVYPDGSQIITVLGPRGEVVYRGRRDRGGREIVLIREVTRAPLARIDLGPIQLRIPREQYIVDSRRASRDDIYIALSAPPVEPVERVYSLEEVRSFDRIRDKMRRIDVSDITFESDSAVITPDQAEALEELASVINDLIDKNPGETFLIEGHTDAAGSDIYNLTLSDRRAEAVAVALSEYYDVPPENLVTQGYGEQFLKIPTEEPERENRRAAVRRVTPLVNQVAN